MNVVAFHPELEDAGPHPHLSVETVSISDEIRENQVQEHARFSELDALIYFRSYWLA
jgi:hypothetical protein